ncbi:MULTISPECIES: superinfection immunity protein [Rheinheimera]|uniref:Superinfection immunity protein n=1 Tax=Rheinheimera aquimaris TaxID=412437 RepID=A0ABP3NM51_9GAMM|nr:superinfection immunity protein [Rheinheimera aquimaris]MCB5212955.1 superinfection immunity protein [Rheinheimera aquimaris]|tara:strand:+ start:397 stop:675 length:279 start_codon:yes stop_codon:yes gene_type:complete
MDTINQFIVAFTEAWQQADLLFLLGFGLLFLAVWFLPSLLALAFNRQHAGKIALLNIPAGFSWIAWVALLVWAVTGKLSNKLAAKARLKPVV